MTIDVTRDTEGLRLAAREMLAYFHAARVHERLKEKGFAGERPQPPASLAEGYYAWMQTLVELDNKLNLRVLHGLRVLQAVELEGLAILAAARDEFLAEHPPCPHCGVPRHLETDTLCWQCLQELPKKD